MTTFKNVVTTLSVTLVFFGVILMLVPETKMKRSFVSFASVVLVTCVIVSLSMTDKIIDDIDLDLHTDLSFYENIAEIGIETEAEAARSAVKKVVEDALKKEGVEFYEVSVTVDIFDDTSISIGEVLILCSAEDKKISENILKDLGLNGRVTVN